MQNHESEDAYLKQSVVESKIGKQSNVKLYDALDKLREIDFDNLRKRVLSVQRSFPPIPADQRGSIMVLVERYKVYMDVLTKREREIFEQFYKEVAIDNRDVFNGVWGGSFEKLLSQYPEVIGCQKLKGAKGALAPDPCDLECIAYGVSMASMYASIGGGFVAFTLAAAGFALATESLNQCLAANNMESCW